MASNYVYPTEHEDFDKANAEAVLAEFLSALWKFEEYEGISGEIQEDAKALRKKILNQAKGWRITAAQPNILTSSNICSFDCKYIG